ncbi:transposase [Vibrio vulnificus]|uniref:transposase n=1 Tax=Vibrio vulnificus TaxID=672 RepID=UPI0018DCF495|nr:transposase [Vibrio vulnificus]EIY8043152.1 transposase [Vibrio vulnificus]EIZ4668424.1 transposase [Vibrio vulnificus]EJA3101091.1 transposase [Vibrio vulnificus]EJC6743135.1 transposase [Vibrio vulnificus]
MSSVPGIGPIVATGLIPAVGSGTQFKRGRDMSAWLGLGSQTILHGWEKQPWWYKQKR